MTTESAVPLRGIAGFVLAVAGIGFAALTRFYAKDC